MTRHLIPEAATGSRGTTSDGGTAVSVSKRRLNSSNSSSAKLHSKSIDNSQRRSPGKLRQSSSGNLRISNRRDNSRSSSRSVDNISRSPGKLR
jgi:hypothetical protein